MTSSSDATSQQIQNNKDINVHGSFKEIVHQYDGFILDQFGVLHNGVHGLQGAPECVTKLANEYNKKLIILSNSSSSSESCKAKLPKLGFNPKDFVGAVTSGQEAGNYIRETYDSNKKALFLTWKTPKIPSPLHFIELCGGVTVTDIPEEADFVILHGVDILRGPGNDGEAKETSLGDFLHDGKLDLIDPILKKCKANDLQMVCCNPDFIMVKPDSTIGHMPGKIAQRYEELGGKVISFGKPYKEHFEACLRDLGLPKDRVAHVGDSLHHDIAGANDTGIASVFVAGGIHCEELSAPLGTLPDRSNLESIFQKHGQRPTHVVPMFRF
jgi:HAD superfamily hydrolase (TIGR01450 family)